MKKIAFVFGTRPEAIKLAPLVLAMHNHRDFLPYLCITGQHREMLQQVLDVFEISPDADLSLMRPGQSLAGLTARAIEAIDTCLRAERPDMVLVQGDTTTAFCAALCAFYLQIPLGHVEAGLRTGNRFSPFPEEVNRVMISQMADLHFAPTDRARRNLLNSTVRDSQITVTGNTVIDALHLALGSIEKNPPAISELPEFLQPASSTDDPPMVLITGHRRENFGEGLERLCRAIVTLATEFPEVHFVYPVHLNPVVQKGTRRFLATGQGKNIHLIEPVGYLEFVAMMHRATLILSDSGGVQEEAPSLGKPVLVTRETTERPEALETSAVQLVGTDEERIRQTVRRLLTDEAAYRAMARTANPFGDGHASDRILDRLKKFWD
jgi:UDP-N-acetylglucosamine 2-epimerase (non-hydrolysing)